jgi:hypothetical protein
MNNKISLGELNLFDDYFKDLFFLYLDNDLKVFNYNFFIFKLNLKIGDSKNVFRNTLYCLH